MRNTPTQKINIVQGTHLRYVTVYTYYIILRVRHIDAIPMYVTGPGFTGVVRNNCRNTV